MSHEIDEILLSNDVGEEDRDYIKTEILSFINFVFLCVKLSITEDKSFNSYHTPKRKHYEDILRTSPELMGLLMKLYYYDFIVFDFTFPSLGLK